MAKQQLCSLLIRTSVPLCLKLYLYDTHGEGFHSPSYCILFWGILHASNRSLELGGVRISWHRNHNFHIVGSGATLELRLGLYHVFHSAVSMALDHRLDPDEWLHLKINMFHFRHTSA